MFLRQDAVIVSWKLQIMLSTAVCSLETIFSIVFIISHRINTIKQRVRTYIEYSRLHRKDNVVGERYENSLILFAFFFNFINLTKAEKKVEQQQVCMMMMYAANKIGWFQNKFFSLKQKQAIIIFTINDTILTRNTHWSSAMLKTLWPNKSVLLQINQPYNICLTSDKFNGERERKWHLHIYKLIGWTWN